MNVEKIMTRMGQRCRAEDSLSHAAMLMWDHDCGCIPVVDEHDRVIGIVTDRDICMAGLFANQPPTQIRVSTAMATRVITCHASDTIETAEQLMQRNQIRRVPIVDDDGQLVGLLSLSDIARFARTPGGQQLDGDVLGDTLAAVCEPRAHGSAWLT